MKGYSDLKHDGGSHVVEQITEQQDRIQKRLSTIKHIIAIGSGKGGVGKSTLVALLACALKERGFAISIFDADLNGPCQGMLLGLEDTPIVPGERGLCVPKTSDGIGVFTFASLFKSNKHVEFDTVATGSSHTWRATREFSAIAEILESTDWGVLDFLLIDLPPGPERTVQFAEFLGTTTELILVTTPSELSVEVVKRTIHGLQEKGQRLKIIQNMDGYLCSNCKTIQPMFEKTNIKESALPIIGSLPFDPKLSSVSNKGLSIAKCQALSSFEFVRKIATHCAANITPSS